MNVFVVTPYLQEPIEWLRECHESVARQSVPCTHVMVADGHPRPEIDGWRATHVKLPGGARDYGGTPRAIGGLFAQGQRAEAVAYLDADNWYGEHHIEKMIESIRLSGADLAVGTMRVYTADKGFSEPHDDSIHSEFFADTNRLFLTRAVFNCLDVWARIPPRLSVIHDRLFWMILISHARKYCMVDQETVAYRIRSPDFYLQRDIPLPETPKTNKDQILQAYAFWNGLDQEQRDAFFLRMGGHMINMRAGDWAKRYELRSTGAKPPGVDGLGS